jgi:hypothetical protein
MPVSDDDRDTTTIDETDKPADDPWPAAPDDSSNAGVVPDESQSQAPAADAQAESQQAESQQAESQQAENQPADNPPADNAPLANAQQIEGAGDSAQPSDAGAGTGTADELSAGRRSMLALIDKWMPTSLSAPRIPDGESQDLLALAGWTKATGESNKKVKDDGGHPATSCGDVLKAMLGLWKSNFMGAFMIRDMDATGHGPGAKKLGYYVEADQLVREGDVIRSPKPGDIIVLRNGVGSGSAGSVGHVGILVEAGASTWRTADGGGGALPDQTARVTDRDVRWADGVPILKSPTDLREKQLDGWVDLDRLEQTG